MKCFKPTLAALLASSLFSTFSAFAQAPLPQTEAEVRKVDKTAGMITLKHGEIKNLNMGPMTMVFKAKDPALLNKVKAGDKVRFTAAQVNGALTVLSIKPSK